jgi:multiple sugar transport system permease protein
VAFILFICILAVTLVQLCRVAQTGGRRTTRENPRPSCSMSPSPLIALLVLFPLAWMLSVSFMSTGEASAFPPPLLPKVWTLEHYRDLFVEPGHGPLSCGTASPLATLGTACWRLAFTVPAGYAFAKLRFRGRERIFQILVGALVVPAQIGTLPLFLMLKSMGLVNTYAGRAGAVAGLDLRPVPGAASMRLSIPDEMLEAARIDGASESQIFRSRWCFRR